MPASNTYVQTKWQEGFLPGIDCLFYGDGTIIPAEYRSVRLEEGKHTWHFLEKTTIEKLENNIDDIWTPVDLYRSSLQLQNETIVSGDGAMGSDGFVASITGNNLLNWSFFFTFSNPIDHLTLHDDLLICSSDNGHTVSIRLSDLSVTNITYVYGR